MNPDTTTIRSRYMRQLRILFSLLAFSVGLANAEVAFYGYQKNFQVHYNQDLKDYDTVITLVQQWLGPVQLEISEINVTPKGSYLDIVEDAWISGSVSTLNMKDMTDNFMIKGTIPIPNKAAVTGLLTWKNETCYKAELQPSRYNFDKSYLDSISLNQAMDSKIALLQQQSETVYEATFSHIDIGERKHVRIRYLLPDTGSGIGIYTVPVLFHSSATQAPRYTQLTVQANASSLAYNVVTANREMPIRDIASVSLPYQPNIVLKYASDAFSTMSITSFPDGPFAGNYALLNTEVNDSLLGKLSRPIQTVFIWRWNSPIAFIDYANQMKGLSSAAYQIINQASHMKATIQTLKKRGYSCGFTHLIEGQNVPAFQTREINDSSAAQAIAYLSKFDEQSLFSKYSDQPDPAPSWLPIQVAGESFIDKVRNDFFVQIASARRLMNDKTCFHHIILVSVGDVSTSFSKDLHDTLAAILDSATIDMYSAQWRGVNTSATIPSGMNLKLVPYWGFNFPMFFPATVQLGIYNNDRPFLFPLDGVHPGSFAVSIRMQTAWDTVFNWTGFASNGEKTAVFSMTPYLFQNHSDSGLVKIWAKDENHLTDKEEIYPAGTFGIVTKAAFLQATIQNINTDIAKNVPFLQDNEIHAPRTRIASPCKPPTMPKIKIELHQGILSVTSSTVISKIEFFDLQGRLIGSIDPSRLKAGRNHYRIPLNILFNFKGLKMMVIKISSISQTKIFKLNLEGVQ
jgi:hypothetical protein